MKKKVLSLALCLALAATAVVGGTLAYFTDTDDAQNTFTLGSVKIALHEGDYENVQKNGAPIDKDGKVDTRKANPNAHKEDENFGYDYLDKTYQNWLAEQTLMPGAQGFNRMQKRIFVENTGEYDAYVRVIVGVPSELDTPTDASKNILHFNTVTGEVNNNWKGWTYDTKANEGKTSAYTFTQDDYNYYVYYYTDIVKAGDATASEVLSYFWLDGKVDFDGSDYVVYENRNDTVTVLNSIKNGKIDIPVYAEAIQADGFDTYTDAWTAYGKPAIQK